MVLISRQRLAHDKLNTIHDRGDCRCLNLSYPEGSPVFIYKRISLFLDIFLEFFLDLLKKYFLKKLQLKFQEDENG